MGEGNRRRGRAWRGRWKSSRRDDQSPLLCTSRDEAAYPGTVFIRVHPCPSVVRLNPGSFSGLSRKTTFEFNPAHMETSEHVPASGFRPASRQRTPSAYRVCDGITEAALYFMVVFAPWSFGTTERWSIWTMNIAGYALGALLLVKWWVGWRASYRPARWESRGSEDGGQTPNHGSQSRDTRAETPDPRPQTPDPRPQTLDAISQTPDARNPRREMPDARSQKTEAARLLTVAPFA